MSETTTDIGISTIQSDIELAKSVIDLVKGGHEIEAGLLIVKNRNALSKQVTAVEALVPIVKEGYKTSEFWVLLLYGAFNWYCAVYHIALPATEDMTLGAMVSAYIAGRHVIKNNAVKAA